MGVDIGVHMVAVREHWSQPLHLPFHGLLACVPGLHSKTFTCWAISLASERFIFKYKFIYYKLILYLLVVTFMSQSIYILKYVFLIKLLSSYFFFVY